MTFFYSSGAGLLVVISSSFLFLSFISVRHSEFLCSFLHPRSVDFHGYTIPCITLFFSSDVMPSSYHSGFQTLGIFPFMIKVAFYCKTKWSTRVCIPELTSCQEWVVVDSSFCTNERYVGKFSTALNDFHLIVCQGIPMDIVVCKRHESS